MDLAEIQSLVARNRTHLGDFVAGAFDGDGTFWTTISASPGS